MTYQNSIIYLQKSFDIWEERSKYEWTLDISKLKDL